MSALMIDAVKNQVWKRLAVVIQPNRILYSDSIPALTLIHQDLGQQVHQIAVIGSNWGHYQELSVQQLDTIVFTQNSSFVEFFELRNAEMVCRYCCHANS